MLIGRCLSCTYHDVSRRGRADVALINEGFLQEGKEISQSYRHFRAGCGTYHEVRLADETDRDAMLRLTLHARTWCYDSVMIAL
jgi:hypothetical protein